MYLFNTFFALNINPMQARRNEKNLGGGRGGGWEFIKKYLSNWLAG